MTHSIRDERTPKDICGEATLGWDTYALASSDPVIQDEPLEWYPNTVTLALRVRPPIGHPLLSGHFQKIISLISLKLTCVNWSPLLRVAVTFSVVPTSSRPVGKTTSYPSYCLHLGYAQTVGTRLNKEVLTGLKDSSSQIR